MQQANIELNESLQSELVRRVMALEGREETLRLSNRHLESTIETLTEYTNVSPNDIRDIASELARSSVTTGIVIEPPSKVTSPKQSKKKLVGFGLAALIGMVIVGIVLPIQQHADVTESNPTVLSTAIGKEGLFHKKAILSSAMADISTIKTMVLMHYYDTGEFPSGLDDIGGHTVEWRCSSNLPTYILMGTGCTKE